MRCRKYLLKLVINKGDASKFANVKSLSKLKRLTAGLINGWTTADVFNSNKINWVGTGHFSGIFMMLEKRRFDYIPRGVHEVYDDLNKNKLTNHGIEIEPNIALYLPTSSYIHVSKSEPRLAKRLTVGLNQLLLSGELKDILYQYFDEEISRANLSARTIIKIENPYHTKKCKSDEQYYLFKPSK